MRTARLSLVALLLIAGCREPAPEPAPESGAPAEPPAGASQATQPSQPPDASEPAEAPASGVVADWTVGVPSRARSGGPNAVLREVRFGRHRGYDRVVLQFEGALPGWHLEYVDHPVRDCGAGRVVPLEGDAHLLVRTRPAQGHTEGGEATVAGRFEPDLPNLIEGARTCDFEGELTFVFGLRSPTPFRVLELDAPPRLVVDVRRP